MGIEDNVGKSNDKQELTGWEIVENNPAKPMEENPVTWDDLSKEAFAGDTQVSESEVLPDGSETHETNEVKLIDTRELPLSDDPVRRSAQEKLLAGATMDDLTFGEKLKLGRDETPTELNGYELKPNCAYRTMTRAEYDAHKEAGFILSPNEDDEYNPDDPKKTNAGIDWYIGGASLRYGKGEVVIEVPADEEYFTLTRDHGCGMAKNPLVRHAKSSGGKHNPVPFEKAKVIYTKGEPNGETSVA